MLASLSPLLAIPPELLERIALELALSNSRGPPVHLIALLCTCKYVHHTLTSTDLHAKIFKGMFDVDAPRRRLGPRALHSRFLASQLRTYCHALRRIHHGDIFAPDVEDVLRTAFILLTENDGKNRAQLEWANAYAFVNSFVRRRLWHDTVNGWPRDSPLHAFVLWVMWCMTDQDILTKETSDERNDLITYILPYTVAAFKYLSYFAPDHHFILPLPEEWEPSDLVSVQTAHGEYPILPPRGDATKEISHYDHTLHFRAPPITIAAKLIFFSRREVTPLQVPVDLLVDRPTALAQGISWGQTQADLIEVNSHSSAQLVPPSHWDWKSTLTPEQRLIEEDGAWRHDLLSPSASWDNDWERSVNCWDPWAQVEFKGTVYTFGSMDGLWQGRLLIPETERYMALVTNPHYPKQFGETDPAISLWPLFLRLKEHHCVSPQEPVPPGGQEDDPVDDGIRNAWFPPVKPVMHQGRAILNYPHQGEMYRTVHETFERGQNNSHDENTCLTCQARREPEEPMPDFESAPTLRHSDYEGDFAEAGLGRSSYDDIEVDTYETTCTGIRDIIFTGETDLYHGMAWGRYTFLGRVRSWDGLIALVRLPADPTLWGRSRWVFRGYLHYGKVLVGSWRGMTTDVDSIPWEGPFVASKRA